MYFSLCTQCTNSDANKSEVNSVGACQAKCSEYSVQFSVCHRRSEHFPFLSTLLLPCMRTPYTTHKHAYVLYIYVFTSISMYSCLCSCYLLLIRSFTVSQNQNQPTQCSANSYRPTANSHQRHSVAVKLYVIEQVSGCEHRWIEICC